MPRPHNERRALERERADLPRQLVAYQAKLDTTAPGHKAWRERLAWQIRRVQKRLAEVDALLTGDEKGGHPQ